MSISKIVTLTFAVLLVCRCGGGTTEEDADVAQDPDVADNQDLPPTIVHIEYTVSYMGSTDTIRFDGEVPAQVDGACSITDSGDPAYPLLLNFRFIHRGGSASDQREIQVYGLKMKASLSPEILPCSGINFNYGGVEPQAGLVECGDAAEGRCAFTGVSFDEAQEIVSGTFICGSFPTNMIAPEGPVLMEIMSGNFSLAHCQR